MFLITDPWVKPVSRLCDYIQLILYTIVAQTIADMCFFFNCIHGQGADKAVVDKRFSVRGKEADFTRQIFF